MLLTPWEQTSPRVKLFEILSLTSFVVDVTRREVVVLTASSSVSCSMQTSPPFLKARRPSVSSITTQRLGHYVETESGHVRVAVSFLYIMKVGVLR